MYLPVNREVDLQPAGGGCDPQLLCAVLRFKQDAVPGLNIHMHFKPTEIGEYEIACAELCGLGHYKMHGMVHVVSQEDFDKWLAAGRRRNNNGDHGYAFMRTLLRGSSGNTFSASITKSSAFSIFFWRSQQYLWGCFYRC